MPDLESIARDRAARITQLEQWCTQLELERAALMKRVERSETNAGLSGQSAEWARRETIEALGRTSEARNETRQVKSALDEARAEADRILQSAIAAGCVEEEFCAGCGTCVATRDCGCPCGTSKRLVNAKAAQLRDLLKSAIEYFDQAGDDETFRNWLTHARAALAEAPAEPGQTTGDGETGGIDPGKGDDRSVVLHFTDEGLAEHDAEVRAEVLATACADIKANPDAITHGLDWLVDEARAEERERCARKVECWPVTGQRGFHLCQQIAADIRAGSKPPEHPDTKRHNMLERAIGLVSARGRLIDIGLNRSLSEEEASLLAALQAFAEELDKLEATLGKRVEGES